MKYIIVLIFMLLLTACMSDHNAKISVNVYTPPNSQTQLLRADPIQNTNPTANSSTNADTGSGVTIVIKHMVKEVPVSTGINATIPASTLGGM